MNALMTLLGFLLRLVIFLLTGEWVRLSSEKTDGEPTAAPRPKEAPRPAPTGTFTPKTAPSPRKGRAPRSASTRVNEALAAADKQLAEADQLVPRLEAAVSGASLVGLLEAGVGPLRRTLVLAKRGQAAALVSLPERVDEAARTTALLRLAAEQRRDPVLAGMLADVDACIDALAQPIYDNANGEGMVVMRRRSLALVDVDGERLEAAFARTPIAPVVVPRELGDAPERWVMLGRVVGRRMLLDVPGWAGEHYEDLGLPPALMLPPSHAGYDPETASAAFGVWLPELFADAFAAFCLGPAYVAWLVDTLARKGEPMQLLIGYSRGRFLHGLPPSELRVQTGLAVLTRLGLHAEERKLRARFDGLSGPKESLYLPFDDGAAARIPLSFMLARLSELLERMLDDPHAALGDDTWLDVPGFGYLHAEHSTAESAAKRLAAGQPVHATPRIVIAAAQLAVQANAKARGLVAQTLRRSIRGAGTLETVPDVYQKLAPAQSGREGARRETVGAVLRDKRALREAFVLGTAFAPRRR